MWADVLHLCEGEPGLVVDLEDLLDGVDVRGRPQVQTQVVLAGRAHDLLRKQKRRRYDTDSFLPAQTSGTRTHPCRSLHGVGQPGVDDVLL